MSDPKSDFCENEADDARLGRFFDDAISLQQLGLPIDVESLLDDRPDLVEKGRKLLRVLPSRVPQPFPDDFYVIKELGQGAFGRVWLAEDLHLPRQVAIKTIHVPSCSAAGKEALQALRNDGACLAKLKSPNVVRVYSWRKAGENDYLILEYISGGSLDELVKTEPLPWDRAARYIADVSEALVEAHKLGIIHRDIKPANILLDTESVEAEAKLTDFGIASRLGSAGKVIGTQVYMAPEAFQGQSSAASDVYGLSASLFRLVTGEVPFRGANSAEQLALIEKGFPNPDPRFACMPDSLEQVIRAGLAANPESRPTLVGFLDRLRGSLNQSLADSLPKITSDSAGLHLRISRKSSAGHWQPVAATDMTQSSRQRDMRRVPSSPDQVGIRTGEIVRIEVTAERDGYLTLFNIGPTGNLNLLYPDRLNDINATRVLGGQPILIPDIVFEPPAGRERVFAIWSLQPLPLKECDLMSITGNDSGVRSPAYRASRDMRRMKQAVESTGLADCRVTVLEMEHDA